MYYLTNNYQNNKFDVKSLTTYNFYLNNPYSIDGKLELRKNNVYFKHKIPDIETCNVLLYSDPRNILDIKYFELYLIVSGEPLLSLKPYYQSLPTDVPTLAPTLFLKDNSVVRDINSNEFYYFNKFTIYLIPNAIVFMSMGFEWSDVVVVSAGGLSGYEIGHDCPC
jgi:hypothetical protein